MRSVAPGARQSAALTARTSPGRGRVFPEIVAVKSGTEYLVIRLECVSWIQARGNYSLLHSDRPPRLVGTSLARLTRLVLDPAVFLRIHRSAIVNIREIVSVRTRRNGDLTLMLRDGRCVPCSRRYRRELDRRIRFLA